MTTTSVKDVGTVMNLGAAASKGFGKVGNANFQNIWNAQTGKGGTTEQPENGAQTQKSLQPHEKAVSGNDRANPKQDALRKGGETVTEAKALETKAPEDMSDEEFEEAMEVVATAAAELIQQVADTFQMPVEDVQELTSELGFEPVEILNPENLSKLLLVAGGADDTMALLTDEQLYADYLSIMQQGRQSLEETADTLQMTPGQLVQVVEEGVEPQEPVADVPIVVEAVTEETVVIQKPEIEQSVDEKPVAAEANAKEPVPVQTDKAQLDENFVVQTDLQPVANEVVDDAANKTVEIASEPVVEANVHVQTQEPKQEKAVETEEKDVEVQNAEPRGMEIKQETVQAPKGQQQTDDNAAKDRKDDHREASHGHHEGNPMLQAVRNEEFLPRMEDVQEPLRAWDTDTQNLMRQIMDYMRIQVRPNVSSLEMQLHPANLGTLQIQIASKGGMLTANFITQNEAVKAALESQMVQLKESFEQQGVKVEAIEVTVQTHQFEQNLEQGRGRQSQESGEKRGRTRRIDLNGMDEQGDEAAADSLEAQMLAAGGGTVNYTA